VGEVSIPHLEVLAIECKGRAGPQSPNDLYRFRQSFLPFGDWWAREAKLLELRGERAYT
jgi:hypothetical protein